MHMHIRFPQITPFPFPRDVHLCVMHIGHLSDFNSEMKRIIVCFDYHCVRTALVLALKKYSCKRMSTGNR